MRSSIIGFRTRRQSSRVISPTCLWRTRPVASTMKVSGAPVTPKSIATRPSASSPIAA
ncbi:MAG: hypothetical protein ACK4NP_10260 [Parvularculaceae bacterium]